MSLCAPTGRRAQGQHCEPGKLNSACGALRRQAPQDGDWGVQHALAVDEGDQPLPHPERLEGAEQRDRVERREHGRQHERLGQLELTVQQWAVDVIRPLHAVACSSIDETG